MLSLDAMLIGFILDAAFGDPQGVPHIVSLMGKAINWLEKELREAFPKSKNGETAAGAVMVVVMLIIFGGGTAALLKICERSSALLRLIVESFICWQCLAMLSLGKAGMSVYEALISGDIARARMEVGKIVGRDTDKLEKDGIIRATVETVAENSNDGVIAPLFFMAIGGGALAVAYKAVNTMDSMVGYKNEKYINFGHAAAKLDDVCGYIPARLSALLEIAVCAATGFDAENAWRIFKRDRYNHKSPNSAQTEAVFAGALHIMLGGDSYYFGKLVEKPTIGDADRPVESEDIVKSRKIMTNASVLALLLLIILRRVLICL